MRRSIFCNGVSKRFGCNRVGWGGIPLKPRSFSPGSRHFLDRMYGHEVLDHLLERYHASGLPRAIIIAHSSLAEANDLLVERGADCALEKIKGEAQSQAVAFAFRTPEAIRWFRQHRSPMPAP